MGSSTKTRSTNTNQKHLDLYHNYRKVIAKYGGKVQHISKTQLAIEANNLPARGGFYYSDPDAVMRIILKMTVLDREGKLKNIYPTKTTSIQGWGNDQPPGDWFQCTDCQELHFKPHHLPNGEIMITPNFCPCCGTFIKTNDSEEHNSENYSGE